MTNMSEQRVVLMKLKSDEQVDNEVCVSWPIRAATATLASNPDKKTFFDMPGEIRDLIYEYAITAMRRDATQNQLDREICKHDSNGMGRHTAAYCKSSNIHACGDKVLKMLQAKPRRVMLDRRTCQVEHHWLQNLSLVSEQFGSELRAVLFHTTIIHFDKDVEIQDGRPLPAKKDYLHIIASLGVGAKSLRRLAISVVYDCSTDCNNELDRNWDWREEHYDDIETEDAEEELKALQGLLHPRVSIFLAVERSFSDGMNRSSFHVTVSEADSVTLVARRLSSGDDIKPFIAYLQHFGYYPEALPYYS